MLRVLTRLHVPYARTSLHLTLRRYAHRPPTMILPPVISIPPEDEIVEDSEPEREERRQQRRAQRQRQVKKKPRRTTPAVVVVSSESDSPPPRPYPTLDNEVIEISGNCTLSRVIEHVVSNAMPDSSESSDVERVEAYLRDEGDLDDVGVDEAGGSANLPPLEDVSSAAPGAGETAPCFLSHKLTQLRRNFRSFVSFDS